MAVLPAVVDLLVETFGPFLIPAGLFAAGVAFYAVLWWLGDRDLLP